MFLPTESARLTLARRCAVDFIPLRLHAAIRQNLTIAQGNADVTQYVQAALDFVGCDTTKGGPVAPRALGSVHFPGGRCEPAAIA